VSAILTLASGRLSGPHPVRAAPPGRVADQTEALLALVADDRVVGARGVDCLAIGRVFGVRTLHRW